MNGFKSFVKYGSLGIGMLLLWALFLIAGTWLIYLGWNNVLAVAITGVSEISFFQAFVLWLMVNILTDHPVSKKEK